jgi:hypothetical protein
MRDAVTRYLAPATAGVFLALQGADRTATLAWGVLTLGTAGALLTNRIDWRRPLITLEWAGLAVLAAFAVSAACGVDPARSLLLSVPVLAGVLVWLLAARAIDTDRSAAALIGGLAIAAASQVVLVLVAFAHRPDGNAADWVIDAGAAWLIVPNDIAWIGCALPLFAACLRRERIALAVLLIAYLLVCLLLRSRTAAVVACVSSLWFALASSTRMRERRQHWIAAGVIAMMVAGSLTLGIASMHARQQLWAAAWSMFLDHPLCGIGIHDFVIAYRAYLPPESDLIDARLTPWPHNLVLEIAAETGLLGIIAAAFVAGCLLQWAFGVHVSPRDSRSVAVRCAWCALALLAVVEASLLRQWFWFFATTLSVLVALDCLAQRLGKQRE